MIERNTLKRRADANERPAHDADAKASIASLSSPPHCAKGPLSAQAPPGEEESGQRREPGVRSPAPLAGIESRVEEARYHLSAEADRGVVSRALRSRRGGGAGRAWEAKMTLGGRGGGNLSDEFVEC